MDGMGKFGRQGWSAVHAESPATVAQATWGVAGVVALAPAIENTSILAAMRIDPCLLILAQTKSTPRLDSPWSLVAHETLDTIRLYSSKE
jgi:hypothetical protein